MSAGSAGQTSEPPPARARSVRWQWVVVLGAVLLMVPAVVALWSEYRIKWWIEEVRLADGSVIELHRRTEFHKVGEWARRGWATKRERFGFVTRGEEYEAVVRYAAARFLGRCGTDYCLLAERSGGYACYVLSPKEAHRVDCRRFPVSNVQPNVLLPADPESTSFPAEVRFPHKEYLLDQERQALRLSSEWPVPALMQKQATRSE
jgi:hypothetical protein